MVLLPVTGSSVSSTLQRNTKEYGKKFMFDGCGDTCWNSDQGESQHVSVRFGEAVHVKKIRIQVFFSFHFFINVITYSDTDY